MFEFYMVVTVPDTSQEEIKKCQYEETDENLRLNLQLENELSAYEYYYTYIEDRYYHYSYDGPYTGPINLSEAVFQNDCFVGCLIDGKLHSLEKGAFLKRLNERVDVEITIRKKSK